MLLLTILELVLILFPFHISCAGRIKVHVPAFILHVFLIQSFLAETSTLEKRRSKMKRGRLLLSSTWSFVLLILVAGLTVSCGEMQVIADQLEGPVTDLLWHNRQLYVAQMGKVSIIEPNGYVRDIVTGLPSQGDHHNNQLSAGPDGKIYFGQGTVTNSGVVGVDNFMMMWLRTHPFTHDISPRNIRLNDRPFATLNPIMLASDK
jgi:hypothetical protein